MTEDAARQKPVVLLCEAYGPLREDQRGFAYFSSLLCLSIAVLLSCSGCALSKPIHSPGLVTHWDKRQVPSSPEAPQISMVVYVRRTFLDDRPSPSWFLTWSSRRMIQRVARTIAREFPFLANIEPETATAPYRLVIQATHARRMDEAQAFFTALSLGLIPHTAELTLELEAHVYRGTTLVKQYRAMASHHLRINFLSLLLGGGRVSVPRRTIEDTFRDLFLQIQQDASELFIPEQPHGA